MGKAGKGTGSFGTLRCLRQITALKLAMLHPLFKLFIFINPRLLQANATQSRTRCADDAVAVRFIFKRALAAHAATHPQKSGSVSPSLS